MEPNDVENSVEQRNMNALDVHDISSPVPMETSKVIMYTCFSAIFLIGFVVYSRYFYELSVFLPIFFIPTIVFFRWWRRNQHFYSLQSVLGSYFVGIFVGVFAVFIFAPVADFISCLLIHLIYSGSNEMHDRSVRVRATAQYLGKATMTSIVNAMAWFVFLMRYTTDCEYFEACGNPEDKNLTRPIFGVAALTAFVCLFAYFPVNLLQGMIIGTEVAINNQGGGKCSCVFFIRSYVFPVLVAVLNFPIFFLLSVLIFNATIDAGDWPLATGLLAICGFGFIPMVFILIASVAYVKHREKKLSPVYLERVGAFYAPFIDRK